jgi:hypothetical protein
MPVAGQPLQIDVTGDVLPLNRKKVGPVQHSAHGPSGGELVRVVILDPTRGRPTVPSGHSRRSGWHDLLAEGH